MKPYKIKVRPSISEQPKYFGHAYTVIVWRAETEVENNDKVL